MRQDGPEKKAGSIIIIGAGLTGLSAGCYGRMNGYKTTIFEMHSIPGGVCTAWKRKGYTIDGAVNWVVGTKPGGMYHRFWEELGVAQNWEVYNHDLVFVVENREGKAFNLYCDADRLERHMLEVAPEDTDAIRRLTGAIRRASMFTIPAEKPEELYNFIDMIKMAGMLPLMGFMKKWAKVTVGDYIDSLENPFLREVIPLAFGTDAPMVMLIMMLAWQHAKAAGYVIGGALPLAQAVEKRYLDLGGEVHYDSRVEKILVENDKAVGVRLADGSEHRADWVISAADGRTTIFDMLEEKYIDREIKERYENPNLFKPLVYVSLGVAGELDGIPPASISGLTFPLDTPILIAGKEEKTMNVRSYCFDPTLTPEGKNVLIVQYETDFDYWKELSEDPPRYKAEKEKITEEIITGLEQRIPGIREHVEMTDVATPVTWERYTGNWRGAYEGWMFDADSFTSSMKKTLPGLANFYMAGQWVNPGGGLPTAVMSGNHTIQLICSRDRKKFVTAKP
jgi:phytoene dehydrogenase-like protein